MSSVLEVGKWEGI